MKTSDFYYDLPEELIAQIPLKNRADSRLLVLNKNTGKIEHTHFRDLPLYLRPGDRLVLNDTKVLPARLIGNRRDSGTEVELLLLKRLSDQDLNSLTDLIDPAKSSPDLSCCFWETLAGPGKRARTGHILDFGYDENKNPLLSAHIIGVKPDGNRIVRFEFQGVFEEIRLVRCLCLHIFTKNSLIQPGIRQFMPEKKVQRLRRLPDCILPKNCSIRLKKWESVLPMSPYMLA